MYYVFRCWAAKFACGLSKPTSINWIIDYGRVLLRWAKGKILTSTT